MDASLGGFDDRSGAVGHPPEHYGNPIAEQRVLATGAAVVDLSHHDVLTVTGPDRLSWIDSLTSQSVAGLQPGESTETLLLDPTGRIESAMRVLDDGETLWLLLDPGAGAPLHRFLSRMIFMLQVEVADRSSDVATIATVGSTELPEVVAAAVMAPHGIPLIWRDPWSRVGVGGVSYASSDGHPGAEWVANEVLVPRAALADLAASAVPAAGTLALEALRIAAWRPRWASEVDATTIPHELDWLRSAVHLAKGCYRGQETVAKVHNLGHPPRRLVLLHLDGSDGLLPAPGDEVLLGDNVVGRITSSARHHELGPIALAVVKRTTDPGTTLEVAVDGGGRVAAQQEVIVPPDAGAAVERARLPRITASRAVL